MGAWHITRKDLRLLFRDRYALLILLALPLVFMTIIGMSVGEIMGWRAENQNVKLAILDYCNDELSRDIAKSLDDRPGIAVRMVRGEALLDRLLDRKEANAGVIIAPEFRALVDDLVLGEVLETRVGPLAHGLSDIGIEVVYRESFANVGGVAKMIVYGETLRTIAPFVARKNVLAKNFIDGAREAHAEPPPPPADAVAVATPTKLSYAQLVPSYTVLFVFFLVTIMARSFLAERDQGTLKRLRIAPISSVELMIGKTAPFFVLSLTQTLLLFAAGHFLFGMSWGPRPDYLLAVIACTSLAATALGLMTATIVKTDSQVSAYTIFVLLTMGGLSGCLVPREFLPAEMQDASLCTPHAWALIGFQEVLSETSLDAPVIWQSCAALCCFALVFFSVGCQRFGRQVG